MSSLRRLAGDYADPVSRHKEAVEHTHSCKGRAAMRLVMARTRCQANRIRPANTKEATSVLKGSTSMCLGALSKPLVVAIFDE